MIWIVESVITVLKKAAITMFFWAVIIVLKAEITVGAAISVEGNMH